MSIERKLIRKILRQKDWIAEELYWWAKTFDNEIDDEGEPCSKAFDFIHSLAEKLENNQCDNNDYSEILFHIYQINYDRRLIKGWAIGVDYSYQFDF